MSVPTTEFTPHDTSIPGLLVFEVSSIGDERGWFQEKFHKEKLTAAGLPTDFDAVQTNISYNKHRGVARGLHAEPWQKYVSVITGKAFVAYVDLRKGPTFGKVESLEIDNNRAVFVPIGVANSFQTLEDETYYIYSVTKHWDGKQYDEYASLNMADPELGISWPIPLEDAIVSKRDRENPNLADIKPMVF